MLLIGADDRFEIQYYSKIDNGKISHVRRLAFGTTKNLSTVEEFANEMRKFRDETNTENVFILALLVIIKYCKKPNLYLNSMFGKDKKAGR